MRKLYMLCVHFSAQMKKQNISTYAASIAFFFFLSFVPMLIMLCAVLPFTPLTEQNLIEAITNVMPGKVVPLASSIIADVYDKSAGIMSIAAIATIWSAAKGVMALINGLNAINGVEERRNYFVVRLIASVYTIVMLLVVILSLVLNVFGRQIVKFTLYRFPNLQEPVAFLMNFRFIVVWGVLTLFFAAIYAFVPNRRLNFREQIPGAMFTSITWSVFSWGFSLYVNYENGYGIYGSLSIIIIMLLWMYFCMYIIMIGAYLNHYFNPVNKVLVQSIKQEEKRSTK